MRNLCNIDYVLKLSLLIGNILKQHLKDLNPYFPIKTIGYLRYFDDNSFFYTSSEKELINEYYKVINSAAILCNQLLEIDNTDFFLAIWPDKYTNYTLYSESYELYKKHNILDKGASFIKKKEKGVELWWIQLHNDIEKRFADIWIVNNKNMLCKIFNYIMCKYFQSFRSISQCQGVFFYQKDCEYKYFNQSMENLSKCTKKINIFFNSSLNFRTFEHNNSVILLGNREFECLTYLKKGFSNKEIARKLNISDRTVESHINNIKEKVCINYKGDLIELFDKHNYLWY